ncbi:hypothetical protein DFH08DRAFT_1077311 [Mycena albidolilacea]|uniref:Uncharacterized protein n=1 Tax=Mycena albidolilacea TaxID=1033008 RepID=A0AAD7ACQ8_9AGAR|nr:hypothetical protein DFH08DRAFT_1077311 [Mycena albidolilacea]
MKNGFTDGSPLRKFMFSSLGLTDPDACLGGAALPDLGVIELCIYPTMLAAAPPIVAGPALKVHERSKKACPLAQTSSNSSSNAVAGLPLCPVMTGLANLCSARHPPRKQNRTPARACAAPPASVKRAGASKENKPLVKKELPKGKADAKKRVKREFADDDAINLTQASPGPRRKREGVVQGEVIDLT